MRRLRLPIVAAVVALAGGCQGDPYYDDYARARPATADLVGTWELDPARSDWRPAPGTPAIARSFRLDADGTAVANAIPDVFALGPGGKAAGAADLAGPGRWRLSFDQGAFWTLRVAIPAGPGADPGVEVILHPIGQASPYQIYATIGDPDEGRKLAFKRR